jgi:hypothetical protein
MLLARREGDLPNHERRSEGEEQNGEDKLER